MNQGTQRRIITPDHFKLAPEVLGLPLASPSRRLVAIAIDGMAILLLAKSGGVFLGLVSAFLLFRISATSSSEGLIRKSVRTTLRVSAAIILLTAVVSVWGFWNKDDEDEGPVDPAPTSEVTGDENESFNRSGDPTQAALASAAHPSLALDSTIQRLAAALERDDTVAIPALRDTVRVLVTGPAIEDLEGQARELRTERETLQEQLEEAKKGGIRMMISRLGDDLGIGFGWSAIYFTAFLALWRGQTPGKRFAGVRVLRLDGKPLGWWLSFERFGGYAASFSVGLLGFAQILWDRNRQGLHDKACETVVVIDHRQPSVRT